MSEPYRPTPVKAPRVFCKNCVHRGSYPYAGTCYAIKRPCPVDGTKTIQRPCIEGNANFNCQEFIDRRPIEQARSRAFWKAVGCAAIVALSTGVVVYLI